MPIFVTLWQEVCEISAVENLCCQKVTKVHQNGSWPAAHKCPLLCQISSHSVERCARKALQNFFIPFSLLALQVDHLCQSSPIWVMMYSKAPSIKLPNFVPSMRYLLPKFVNFVNGVANKLTVNDVVYAATNKQMLLMCRIWMHNFFTIIYMM